MGLLPLGFFVFTTGAPGVALPASPGFGVEGVVGVEVAEVGNTRAPVDETVGAREAEDGDGGASAAMLLNAAEEGVLGVETIGEEGTEALAGEGGQGDEVTGKLAGLTFLGLKKELINKRT